MLKWIPLTLGMTALVLSGCGQQADRYEAETLPEPELVLPEPPPMDPVAIEPAPEPVAAPTPAPKPEPRPEPKPEPKPEPNYGIVKDGPYVLQVALSNQKRSIDALAERLRKDGFPAYVTTVENPTPELKGTYYRVRIGAFANTRTARE